MYKVSAIITTCKREAAIVERAVQSVLNQTYSCKEVIIVDDSPEEFVGRIEVEKVINKLRLQSSIEIIYIKHDKCKGACAARNTGLDNSCGEIIGYLDDDDEWCENKVERLIGAFDDESIGLVYCNYIRHDDKTGEERKIKVKDCCDNAYEHLIIHNSIGGTSFPLLRRTAIKSAGKFDTEMMSVQDLDLWLRISQKYRIKYVDEYLVIYHTHDGEQISTNLFKRFMGLKRINEKNCQYLSAHPDAFYKRNIKLVPYYAKSNQKRKAVKLLGACIKAKPTSVALNLRYIFVILCSKKNDQLCQQIYGEQ